MDWQPRRSAYGADWRGFHPGSPATSGAPPESRVPDAAVAAADRTLTNRSADRLDNAGERDRCRVMETASRTGSSLDERLDAAEERLGERKLIDVLYEIILTLPGPFRIRLRPEPMFAARALDRDEGRRRTADR